MAALEEEQARKAAAEGDVEKLKGLVERGTDLKTLMIEAEYHPWCFALHVAAEHGKLEAVTYLIDAGCCLEVEDEEGSTPLFYAAAEGQLEVARELVRRGADLAHENKEGNSVAQYVLDCAHSRVSEETEALGDVVGTFKWLVKKHLAYRHGHPRTGDTLIHSLLASASVFDQDEMGFEAMDLVEWLVNAANNNINAKNKEGRTPLLCFLKDTRLDWQKYSEDQHCNDGVNIVARCLALGADVNTVANDGSTLVHALLSGVDYIGPDTLRCLSLLLRTFENKRLLSQGRMPDGASPLTLACEARGTHAVAAVETIVTALGIHAANAFSSLLTNFPGKDGGTIFHHVSSAAIAEWFIESFPRSGFDRHDVFSNKDKEGRTVVHAAASRFAHSAVALFAEKPPFGNIDPVDVNACVGTNADGTASSSGATALHLACRPCPADHYGQDQLETVQTLLRLGADPLAKDTDGATPLEILTAHGNTRGFPAVQTLLRDVTERAAAAATAAAAGGPAPAASAAAGAAITAAAPLALADLSALRAAGRLTDATLVVVGSTAATAGEDDAQQAPASSSGVASAAAAEEEIPVHSVVLASQSPFFEALLLGQFPRADRRYTIEEVSADTLRTVVDFAYSSVLPAEVGLAAVAPLMRAADKFGMRRLLSVCRVRAAGLVRPRDNDVFAVYDAASAIRDSETLETIERFLLRERCTAWLRELVADKESWAGLCQPGSVVNSLLQSLFLKALEAKDEAGRKRKRADDGE